MKHIDVELEVVGPTYCSDQQLLLFIVLCMVLAIGYSIKVIPLS